MRAAPVWLILLPFLSVAALGCTLHPKIEERIARDTRAWGEAGITEDLVLSVSKHCGSEQRILEQHCHTQVQRILIQDGVVYLNNLIPNYTLGPHEGIGFLVELYEASRVFKLPDVEFSYWLDDHPPAETVLRPDGSVSWPYPPYGLPPMMAWSKSDDNGVLLVPYSGAFRCASDSFDALEAQLDELTRIPWEEREEVAFGRWNAFCTYYYTSHMVRMADGQAVPCPRTYLNNVSDAHPDLVNAYDLSRGKPVPLAHQNRYKFLVSTDGWSISSKFDKYLLLGSAVLRAASIRFGFYYPALSPADPDDLTADAHFIPFMEKHRDDIVEAVQWARAHDAEARRIGEAARVFARQHLVRPARLCYIFRLLTELSKQIRYPISCQRRKLCVPLVEELKFLAKYGTTSSTCIYGELLDKYGATDPAAAPGDSRYEELRAMHEDPLHWPRDDLPA
ncbi:KDEL motif-containing protein 1 [Tetrabaena socialis]|uniref:KDEL motif-containing protein 1 n=1 Tax=Tetrabaena socialis TaxID=47790 RepID=A0A2J8AK96_9CHLO|nr:KDEL motif-containing protein 1 [Tetrabaena socialis]|eukprot:PNH12944.1 KDEL motif-containing protein 1 [Tetrabaena socialis]